jgi:hypothetical protein
MSATQIKVANKSYKPKNATTSFKPAKKAQLGSPVNPTEHSSVVGANSNMVNFTRRDGTKVSFARTTRRRKKSSCKQ